MEIKNFSDTYTSTSVTVSDVERKLLTRAVGEKSPTREANLMHELICNEFGLTQEGYDFFSDKRLVTNLEVIEWYNSRPFGI
jgi:hypothetical protein